VTENTESAPPEGETPLVVTYDREAGSRRKIFSLSLFDFALLALACAFAAYFAFIRFESVLSAFSLEWDSALFLSNGAAYAGFGEFARALDPTKPPVVPFLLSLIFRITGPSQSAGYALSISLYFLAIVGCFLLAKRLLGSWIAIFAATSFAAAPYVLEWSGIILANVEAAGIAALALAIFFSATESGRVKLFLVAIPIALIACLTQFSMTALIPGIIIYLFASHKQDWILDNYEFYYAFGVSIVVFAIFGGQWIAYPLIHHTTISVIFPKLQASGPLSLSTGPAVYLSGFPSQLGVGAYGFFLTFFFLVSLLIVAYKIATRKAREVNPIVLCILTWFFVLLVYYMMLWPSKDIRYSVEYQIPVTILAFWPFSLFFKRVNSNWFRSLRSGSIIFLCLLFAFLLVTGYLEFQSASFTLASTPVPETPINEGIRQAAVWLLANVPANTRIESNWYTLVWWYAPEYNTTAAPLSYQLQSSTDFAYWSSTLSNNSIDYVVYVQPSASVSHFSKLSALWTSQNGIVTIFAVNG
jgi:hypothetical protein